MNKELETVIDILHDAARQIMGAEWGDIEAVELYAASCISKLDSLTMQGYAVQGQLNEQRRNNTSDSSAGRGTISHSE